MASRGIEAPAGRDQPLVFPVIAGRQADLRRVRLRDLRGRKLPGALLTDADLSQAKLQGVDFAYADLRRAKLAGAQLAGATLYHADLSNADLSGVSAEGDGNQTRDLTGATLGSSDLRNANLASAKGLMHGSCSGAVLANAKLPEATTQFEASLTQVAEISKSGSLTFLAMLAACSYSWLTIASTTDVRLINNTSTSPLPIVGTEISIAYFYWLAPAILFGVYLYLQLYLARLWKALGDLPAVFPDGAPLDRKIYPWLLNGLVRIHFDRLRRHRSMPGDKLLVRIEAWISVFLAWWLVPVTLTGLWVSYLRRDDCCRPYY